MIKMDELDILLIIMLIIFILIICYYIFINRGESDLDKKVKKLLQEINPVEKFNPRFNDVNLDKKDNTIEKNDKQPKIIKPNIEKFILRAPKLNLESDMKKYNIRGANYMNYSKLFKTKQYDIKRIPDYLKKNIPNPYNFTFNKTPASV